MQLGLCAAVQAKGCCAAVQQQRQQQQQGEPGTVWWERAAYGAWQLEYSNGGGELMPAGSRAENT